LEIQVDENFINFLDDDEIRETHEIYQRMNDLIHNDNFRELIETEAAGRRLDRVANFKRK
jgi:hypothetical protein